MRIRGKNVLRLVGKFCVWRTERMFLVNKDGNSVIEVKQVDMRLEYDKTTLKEADEIYNGIMAKCYNYGSTENAKNATNRRVKDFLHDKKPLCRILVNDKVYFGDYDEAQGKIVFERILTTLKNGENFIDMRRILDE